jgi:hypothetical protein
MQLFPLKPAVFLLLEIFWCISTHFDLMLLLIGAEPRFFMLRYLAIFFFLHRAPIKLELALPYRRTNVHLHCWSNTVSQDTGKSTFLLKSTAPRKKTDVSKEVEHKKKVKINFKKVSNLMQQKKSWVKRIKMRQILYSVVWKTKFEN